MDPATASGLGALGGLCAAYARKEYKESSELLERFPEISYSSMNNLRDYDLKMSDYAPGLVYLRKWARRLAWDHFHRERRNRSEERQEFQYLSRISSQ